MYPCKKKKEKKEKKGKKEREGIELTTPMYLSFRCLKHEAPVNTFLRWELDLLHFSLFQTNFEVLVKYIRGLGQIWFLDGAVSLFPIIPLTFVWLQT